MGSFDGAETCELVGCYLLSLLTKKYGQNIGLYRDDGLAAFNAKPREMERIKKEICKVFRDNGLKITVEANTTKCIVELYKHAGIFKNTREVRRSTSRRRVLLALLECSQKFPSAYITQQCTRNKFFYFFYKIKTTTKGQELVRQQK